MGLGLDIDCNADTVYNDTAAACNEHCVVRQVPFHSSLRQKYPYTRIILILPCILPVRACALRNSDLWHRALFIGDNALISRHGVPYLSPRVVYIQSTGGRRYFLHSGNHMAVIELFVFFASLIALRALWDYRRRRGWPYPPGPRPLPIIGNVLDIPKDFSWLPYTEFSKKYGM